MPHEIIGICPVCGEKLHVTQLSCCQCGTQISGDFALSKFNALSREELAFAETFLRVQGSIREMEKELGISYPTVKKNLETIIRKMGFEVKRNLPSKRCWRKLEMASLLWMKQSHRSKQTKKRKIKSHLWQSEFRDFRASMRFKILAA